MQNGRSLAVITLMSACTLSGALAGCDSSQGNSERNHAARSGPVSPVEESQLVRDGLQATGNELEEPSGNFGKSLGDMQHSVVLLCMERNGQKPEFEDICFEEGNKAITDMNRGIVSDSNGLEWTLKENKSGIVLTASGQTLFIGKSCDARLATGETGRWNRINGRFTVVFPSRQIEFRGYGAPQVDRCLES